MNDFQSVKGKVAIVTGGTSGIGKGIAKVFGQNGMKVVISGSRMEKGKRVEEELRTLGCDVTFVQANMKNEEDVKRLVDTAIETYGKLHVLVNNAGITQSGHNPVHDISAEEFDSICAVNYRGVFLGTKYGELGMMKSGAENCSIINISSSSGIKSTESFSIYDSSKAALTGFTKSCALDYAKHGITVNAILPGVIETEIYANFPPEVLEFCRKGTPVGRLGDPMEIGYACLFLATDLARFVTGSIISVDGGYSAGDQYADSEWLTPDPRM